MKKNQNSKIWNVPPGSKSAKKPTRRTPVISGIISAVCIIIYLTAVVYATVCIYLSIEKTKSIAAREFTFIADTAFSAGMEGFMEPKYQEVMKTALSNSSKIEALIITGPDGEYAFEKQTNTAIRWEDNSPRFINKFTFSNHEYYRPLPIHDSRGASIKAVAIAFDMNDFVKILKETLIIIMIGFTISFFTMLIQLILGKNKPQPAFEYSSDQDEFEPEITEAGPKGLYSSRSNIGWEEYIKDRLDSELHRCSSTEKDLSLVLIEFTDLTNDEMYRQSAEEAIPCFSSRDLLFEYGKWGIAVILPGVDLETAISKSEKYFQHIMGKFPRGYNSASSICIGLTSRSGRLLNAARLTLEAKEALKKAKSDSKTPIIAFKSDPEKYREFIRMHS